MTEEKSPHGLLRELARRAGMTDEQIAMYFTGQEPEAFHCAAVVTCMGRLRHLRRSLPALLEHSSMPVVLVDYSCPDRCGSWALELTSEGDQALASRLHVVQVQGERYFHKCRALNAGLREAARRWPGWLCVLDADTMIGPAFESWIADNVIRGSFLFMQGHSARRDLSGVLVMHSEDYERSGGYDEGFSGWGWEDWDMRCRLHFKLGLSYMDIPWQYAEPIPHSDQERSEHYPTDKQTSHKANFSRINDNVRAWTGRDLHGLDVRTVRKLFGGMW